MSEISFENFIKPDEDTLNFDVINSNTSFVNALRRIILSEVETVSFDSDDYENSSVKIIENESALHNEFLLHRIGLIPINVDDIDTFNVEKYKFIIDVENKSQKIIDVTSKDIQVMNLETNSLEDNEKFFPEDPFTKDYILINRLKPSLNGMKGESLKMELKSIKNSGSVNSRFSPVSNIYFINKRDPKKIEEALKTYLLNENNTKQKFMIEEADRYFYTDKQGNPNVFEFSIETVGVMKPYKIILAGLTKLGFKIKKFNIEFEKAISNKDSRIKINESQSLMKAFDIQIDDETHTLGHLLQSYLNLMNEDIFVAYKNPHPLKKNIFFRIKVDDMSKLKEIIIDTLSTLINMIDKLRKSILLKFEKKKIIKKKSPKSKGAPAPVPIP